MSNTQMTARELADRLGWDVEEDLALRPEAEVTILEDGTVNALEHGVLIADVARLSAEQMAMGSPSFRRRRSMRTSAWGSTGRLGR